MIEKTQYQATTNMFIPEISFCLFFRHRMTSEEWLSCHSGSSLLTLWDTPYSFLSTQSTRVLGSFPDHSDILDSSIEIPGEMRHLQAKKSWYLPYPKGEPSLIRTLFGCLHARAPPGNLVRTPSSVLEKGPEHFYSFTPECRLVALIHR